MSDKTNVVGLYCQGQVSRCAVKKLHTHSLTDSACVGHFPLGHIPRTFPPAPTISVSTYDIPPRFLKRKFENWHYFVCYISLSFSFFVRADLHQISQEDGKRAAIEKLRFWFLNSFGERGGSKNHFR